MYLLDTNVVSELRKTKKADRGVRVWAQALPAASLYLSAISILELEIGILRFQFSPQSKGARDFGNAANSDKMIGLL